MILNERTLRLMVTLAEELHFGRAAERLHLSQPSLSGALKNLESELGTQLFRRTSRNVVLTDAGRVLAQEARRLLTESERAIALVRSCVEDPLSPFRIGYSPNIDLAWLSSLIVHARQSDEKDDFAFIPRDAASLLDDVIKGELQAALVTIAREQKPLPDLFHSELSPQAVSVAVTQGHRLARAGRCNLQELAGEPMVLVAREADPYLYDALRTQWARHHFNPRVIQEARNFIECMQFASRGVGITFLPTFMNQYGKDGLVFLELADELYVQQAMVYRRDERREPIDRLLNLAVVPKRDQLAISINA